MIKNQILCKCGNQSFTITTGEVTGGGLSGYSKGPDEIKNLEDIESTIGRYYEVWFTCTQCGFTHEVYLGSD